MSLRSSIYSCVIALFIGATYGCATVQFGKEFDSARFETSVEIGVTTGVDVRAWLGDPVSTGVVVNESGERFTRWIYYFGKGRLPSLQNGKLKMLEVRFDRQQIVRAYNWSST